MSTQYTIFKVGCQINSEKQRNNDGGFYTRGRVKAALADYTGAIADFERVIAIKPDYTLAYYAQGLAKQALGEHDAAAFDFAKARALNLSVDKLYPFN